MSLKCLTNNEIHPVFLSSEKVKECMAKWAAKGTDFDFESLPLFTRLEYWKRFIIERIVPNMFGEHSSSLLGPNETGSWLKAWKADNDGDEEEEEEE